MVDFLLELGTEEIPAGYIKPAVEQGQIFLQEHLSENRLKSTNIKTYYTPRRLVFFVTGLPDVQPDVTKEITGPPVSVAFDKDNKPTPAYEGFARKFNLKPADIKIKDGPKGKVCYATTLIKGEKTEQILSEAVAELIRKLP
ncbi:MAG: glycine--tRNA ligase subunit beta [Planctomycetes bacterium]|nr:glycine--tRNA ligase subunit beta [Planctomycetota bacterium]